MQKFNTEFNAGKQLDYTYEGGVQSLVVVCHAALVIAGAAAFIIMKRSEDASKELADIFPTLRNYLLPEIQCVKPSSSAMKAWFTY